MTKNNIFIMGEPHSFSINYLSFRFMVGDKIKVAEKYKTKALVYIVRDFEFDLENNEINVYVEEGK